MTSQNQDNGSINRLVEAGMEAVEEELNSDSHQQNGHHRSHAEEIEAYEDETRFLRTRAIIWGTLTFLFVIGLAFVFSFQNTLADWSWSGTLPRNSVSAAAKILAISPVIVRRIYYVSTPN